MFFFLYASSHCRHIRTLCDLFSNNIYLPPRSSVGMDFCIGGMRFLRFCGMRAQVHDRDQTVLCIGARSLSPWTLRKSPHLCFFFCLFCFNISEIIHGRASQPLASWVWSVAPSHRAQGQEGTPSTLLCSCSLQILFSSLSLLNWSITASTMLC